MEKYYLIITSDNDKLSDVICSKKISSKIAGHFLFASNNIKIYFTYCILERFSKRVYSFLKYSFTVSTGPLRCLAIITSVMF